MFVVIVVGGILPLAFVPLFAKFIAKIKHHTVIGDHDDNSKDLKSYS
jgi:hypothetical protein